MSASAERGESRPSEPIFSKRRLLKGTAIAFGAVSASALVADVVLDRQGKLPNDMHTFIGIEAAVVSTLMSAAMLAMPDLSESPNQGGNTNGTGTAESVNNQPAEQPQQPQRGSERLLSRRGIIFPAIRLNPSQS